MTGKIPFLFLGLLLCGCAAVAAGSPAGHYRLVGEQDVASALVLGRDGRFQYFLSAGALDEQADGHWSLKGKILRLTTEPKPVPPSYSIRAASRSADAKFAFKIVWPDGRGIAGVDFRLGFDQGDPIESYTQEYGWSLPVEELRLPRWIEFAVPMHGLASPRFAIDAARANDLAFTLTPNDLGRVDFEDLPLDVEGKNLIMHRFGDRLIYAREKQRR